MGFQRETLTVNGIPIILFSAGNGPPLLFLHGAGTSHGIEFAEPWTKTHRVLIPRHPNWSTSGEAEWMTTFHDYVMHYLEFIDQLGLQQVDLAGVSMGGRMAAQFASEHRRRVRKLVLIAPAGLNVPGYEIPDFSKLTPEQILNVLTTKPDLIASRLPVPTAEWLAERDREAASFGLVMPNLFDRRFTRWLHRINIPSLLVWGEQDRTTPIQQAPEWRKLIPSIQFLPIPGAGHLALEEDPAVAEQIGIFLNS